MLAENIENLLDGTAFFRTRIEFTIGIGSCPTLAKAIVALGIDMLCFGNLCQVAFALADILTTFEHDRTNAQFYQSEGSKQSARASTNDNSLRCCGDIRIICDNILVLLGLFVDITTHLQIDKNSTLARIYAAPENAHGCQRTDIKAILISQPTAKRLLVSCYMRLYADLVFINHPSDNALFAIILFFISRHEVVDLGNLVLIKPL